MRRSLLLLPLILVPVVSAQDKVSSFGEYEGYSQARFGEWVTTSQLVAMRDSMPRSIEGEVTVLDSRAVSGTRCR